MDFNFNINIRVDHFGESDTLMEYVSTKKKREILRDNGFVYTNNKGWYLDGFLWGRNAEIAYNEFIS
jgi:hypothetical protein